MAAWLGISVNSEHIVSWRGGIENKITLAVSEKANLKITL